MVVCAAPSYLEGRPPPQVPDQLVDHSCLVYPGSEGRILLQFTDASQTVQVHLQGRLTANSMGTLRDAAVRGLGIAVLPWTLAREAVEAGRLQLLLKDWKLPEHGIYAVYPSPRHLSPKVRSFIDFVAGHLE